VSVWLAAGAQYPHRDNRNGTIESICPRCFETIGTAAIESDLKPMEEAHQCDPAHLAYVERGAATLKVLSISDRI